MENKPLHQVGLDPKLVKTLALEGIETTADLLGWKMADLAKIKRVGKTGLAAIYDLRMRLAAEAEAKSPPTPPKPPAPPPVEMYRKFEVELQLRHAQWIDDKIRQTGQTASKVIEFCVRQVFAKDPTRPGRSNLGPEGGGTGLARDNPHRRDRLG